MDDCWRVRLGPGLTEPTVAGDRVYAASSDTHTLHVLDLRSGQPLWSFTAGGRIDSPPTVLGGIALVGSADGWVYCLRCSDGALVWRFLAAPSQRRIVCFDQLESAWPVHGSVLVRDGIAYVAAGRSTYLDGGIRLYAIDPATGKIVHQNTLAGPFPGGKDFPRDVSFYIRGANSNVLASEGNFLYMRQKRLTFLPPGRSPRNPLQQGGVRRRPARVLHRRPAGQLLVQPGLLDVLGPLARLPTGQPGTQERATLGRRWRAHLCGQSFLPPQRP